MPLRAGREFWTRALAWHDQKRLSQWPIGSMPVGHLRCADIRPRRLSTTNSDPRQSVNWPLINASSDASVQGLRSSCASYVQPSTTGC